MTNSRAIAVLGMHRSGTSMVAHLLSLCGLDLGPAESLVPATADNTDGHWEHVEFVRLNDELLAAAGGDWQHPPTKTPDWAGDPAFAPMRAKASRLIRSFSGRDLWGWKDPRTSLTLGFWQSLLPDLGEVVCVRNPLEVACSLRHRGGSGYAYGLDLWANYAVALERSARPGRVVTHYESYFRDPVAELRRVLGALGLTVDPEALARCRETVKPSLRHGRFSTADVAETGVPGKLVAVYERFCKAAGWSQPATHEADRLELAAIATDLARHRAARLHRKLTGLRRQMRTLQQLAARPSAEEPPPESAHLAAYRELLGRVRALMRNRVPRGAIVAVVSKGDDELIRLPARVGWHYPQDEAGGYAGYYPAGGLAAVAHLEVLRARGASYFFLPATSLWWLDTYPDLRAHLDGRYRKVAGSDETGVLYDVSRPAHDCATGTTLDELLDRVRAVGGQPAILDWNSGQPLTTRHPDLAVFAPPTAGQSLPYADNSVDVVAFASTDAAVIAEAQRVADLAAVNFADGETVLVGRCVRDDALRSASIIVPAFNGWRHTAACLRAVFETLPEDFRGEVVVADDSSTDETPLRLAEMARGDPRLRVVRSETNGGFIDACRRGAAIATGDFLIFLNNDTVPLPGWLPPLLATFARFADAGAVTGKLLFPDGRLQEAGGVIFCDASAAHFGRDEPNPGRLLFNYVREIDYGSGALLATPRALFEQLGGFDDAYSPGYYEDVDYCFRVRGAGRRVYYQPDTVAVHIEGATAGTDPNRGMKRHMAVNQDRFRKRWQQLVAAGPSRPVQFDDAAWYGLAHTVREANVR